MAGSLLGIALHEGTSFPVGKVDFCNLYPLTFREFLLACGEEKLLEILDKNDSAMMQVFKTKYTDYLKYYYYVGGMPEAVLEFITNRDVKRVREYEVAVTWLMDVGLVYRIGRVKKPDFPLRAYQDFSAFKLFVVDIGLLGAMSRLNARIH